LATKGQATDQALHRKLAIDLFNLVWDLLDKEDRSVEENDRMIHAAHASRYHWGEIGSPLEFERGEWQISRVYAALNRPQAALYHAQRCLDICRANDIGDFDIAFAYEALTRAYAVAGQAEQSRKYIELGEQAAKNIKDKDDQAYFLDELGSVTDTLVEG
jgi:tetratricopeptide (TPR) repeat protein